MKGKTKKILLKQMKLLQKASKTASRSKLSEDMDSLAGLPAAMAKLVKKMG